MKEGESAFNTDPDEHANKLSFVPCQSYPILSTLVIVQLGIIASGISL